MLILDLSSNNPSPNFKLLKAAGVDGVYLKATEGAKYDADWDVYSEWAPRARAAGLRVGPYHFARPGGGDAPSEAGNFCGLIRLRGGIGRRDLRPVLDMERNDGNLSPEALEKWCRDFNKLVWALTGTLPLFYSYPYFISSNLAGLKEPIGAGLWLADYRYPPYEAPVPAPWRKYVLHQYTSQGLVNGVAGRVDISEAARVRPLLAHPTLGLL